MEAVCPELRSLVSEVNGPLLEKLANRVGHEDAECANLFKNGADLYDDADIDQLWWQCHENNLEVLRTLKEDDNSAELHRLTLKDAALGRMSSPMPASDVDLTQVMLCEFYMRYLDCRCAWFHALALNKARVQMGQLKSGRWIIFHGHMDRGSGAERR